MTAPRGGAAPTGADPWIERFVAHLATERRCSPHTCAAYRRDLERFAGSLGAGSPVAWGAVRPADVRAFLARRHRQGVGPRTLQRELSALRSLYRYLAREGAAARDPLAGISAPKAPARLPRVLGADRLAGLLDAPAGDDPLARRDRALLELLYSSGLRLAEVVALDLEDLDLVQGMVAVTGKGRKRRAVPVGRAAREALGDWLAARGALARADERAVFVSRRGTRLRPRSVEERVARWGRERGGGAALHPHLLRHAFASHLLESSGDLRAVQELLGHADIATTQVYAHLDFQHLARVYDRAHPRARRARGRPGGGEGPGE